MKVLFATFSFKKKYVKISCAEYAGAWENRIKVFIKVSVFERREEKWKTIFMSRSGPWNRGT